MSGSGYNDSSVAVPRQRNRTLMRKGVKSRKAARDINTRYVDEVKAAAPKPPVRAVAALATQTAPCRP